MIVISKCSICHVNHAVCGISVVLTSCDVMMTIETTFLGNSKLAGQVAHSNSAAFDKENEKRVPRLCFVESPPEEADLTEDPITRHFDVTDDEPVDMFSEFYQPYDLTVLESLYPHGMQKSCRYVKSTFFSPHYFRVRKGYFNVANL